ncbi:MAG: hypothetical protein ACLFRD_08065 [Nitriliruptoraceae bacterium]
MPDDTPGPAVVDAADGRTVAEQLRASGERLRTAGPAAGRAWCAAWSDAIDGALRVLAGGQGQGPRFAVVAIGGYGRRELCPNSDVDLLLLHDTADDGQLEQLVRGVVYPLWDAGLTVGYAVRDRRAALDAVDDLDSATATLDLRHVAGDPDLAQQIRTETVRRIRRRGHRFLASLRSADGVRRHRAGDAAEVLEPDIKSGAGGLRDVQSLRWASAGLVGATGLDPLVAAGYLGASDRPRLVAAEQRLLAARVALHLVSAARSGRGPSDPAEVLRLELHGEVATLLGWHDVSEQQLAEHQLLHELFLAARTIDHIHRRAWTLIGADLARGRRRRHRPADIEVEGFELVDGVLRVPQELMARSDLPSRLLAVLTDTGAVLDRRSAAELRTLAEREDGPPGWGWSDADRDRLARTLWRGTVALPALAELDDAGVWAAWLPDWALLRGRPQRNPYHRFALDRHCWHAAAQLGELVRRERWAAVTLAEVDDREALLLGTLLHDVGKVIGEPHPQLGVPLAMEMARRLGARPSTVERIGRYVALHLVLPDAARKRDIADPALARELAGLIGDRSTLAGLHLLAVADGRATGPAAWTQWTADLVGRLVTKVAAVLEQTDPDEVGDGAVVTAAEAQRLAPELGADPAAVRDHLARLPSRYAAAVSPRSVVRHTLMAATRPGPTEVRTRVTPGDDDPDGHERLDRFDVVALDHPGWFTRVAGVVAINGGSIRAADAFTRDDGLAVDTFRLHRPTGASGSWWARVEGDLADAAAGRLALRARVLRVAHGQDARLARLPQVETRVVAWPDPAGRSTVIEVHTIDRLGVLYTISNALTELQLDIVVARVQTVGHEVIDVFYLRDADGGPLAEEHLAELELAITEAIAEL